MLEPASQQIQIQFCEGADEVDNEPEKERTEENNILLNSFLAFIKNQQNVFERLQSKLRKYAKLSCFKPFLLSGRSLTL